VQEKNLMMGVWLSFTLTRGRRGQGVALDPPGAKPLDLEYMKINGFPKAAGLWWVQGKALALVVSIGQSFKGVGITHWNY